jgi:hypothetical protein
MVCKYYFVEEEDDGIPSWVGFAIPEIVSSPGIILAAVSDIMRSSPYHPSP